MSKKLSRVSKRMTVEGFHSDCDAKDIQLSLAEQVFGCVDEGVLILLDLRRDQYHGIQPPVGVKIAQLLSLPHSSSYQAWNTHFNGELRSQIAELTRLGLISESSELAKPITQLSSPSAEVIGFDFNQPPKIGLRDVLYITSAFVKTKVLFHTCSLRCLLQRISKRRKMTVARVEGDTMRVSVEKYLMMRSIFFSVRDRCLLDSLFLIEFLAAYNIYATINFGVRSQPFRAHCWVERGPCVLNDSLSQVAAYSKILEM